MEPFRRTRFVACSNPQCQKHGRIVSKDGRVSNEVGSKEAARAALLEMADSSEDIRQAFEEINTSPLEERRGEVDVGLAELTARIKLLILIARQRGVDPEEFIHKIFGPSFS